MGFFKDLKHDLQTKIEQGARDMATIEHALLKADQGGMEVLLYRRMETEGDSVSYLADQKIDKKVIELFNLSFQAAMKSRTSIIKVLIEILKKN